VLEAQGLHVQLVNARDVKHLPGRSKTDKLDAVWLAKLTEKGLVRPSFVPPKQIRTLRDYTRMRSDLTVERTRYWLRMEKLVAAMLSAQIDGLDAQIAKLTTRIEQLLQDLPAA
jgi:transposase